MDIISIGDGDVVYSVEEAAVPIEELISALEAAQEEGATHVVTLSGNHRGARFMGMSVDWEWVD